MALIGDLRKTIYLTTPGTHVGVDHDAFAIRRPEQALVRAPVSAVEALVCVGHVEVSLAAIRRCAAEDISLSWHTRGGRFVGTLRAPTSGNVLLRIEQYAAAADPQRTAAIAAPIVAAKILNSRTLLLDAAKDRSASAESLRDVSDELVAASAATRDARSLDELRGIEGQAAKRYFNGLATLLSGSGHKFDHRRKHPATDSVNAMLSFMYALLRTRCEAALESVGLDPQVGYLHAVRPGRPSLALDLMEELRAPLCDRLVLTLLNRRQISDRSFETLPGGAVRISDTARTLVLNAWDSHLTTTVAHRAIEQPIERRQIPFLQATLLARHLRGDLAHYIPHRTVAR